LESIFFSFSIRTKHFPLVKKKREKENMSSFSGPPPSSSHFSTLAYNIVSDPHYEVSEQDKRYYQQMVNKQTVNPGNQAIGNVNPLQSLVGSVGGVPSQKLMLMLTTDPSGYAHIIDTAINKQDAESKQQNTVRFINNNVVATRPEHTPRFPVGARMYNTPTAINSKAKARATLKGIIGYHYPIDTRFEQWF
jgi:hypothetical protein